jgi:chitinase
MFRTACLMILCCLLSLASSLHAGSVMLRWTAPTTRADGSPLTNLARMFVFQGTTSGRYGTPLDVGLATSAALSGLQDGQPYYFAVTAEDAEGRESAYSNEATITLGAADTTKPTIAITSPANGSTVPRKGTVVIQANASDNVGVMSVTFMLNGNLLCSDSTAPYSCSWDVPAPPGRTYRLQATAVDAAGNEGISPIVEVTSR